MTDLVRTIADAPWLLLVLYVLVLELAAFASFGIDKRRARRKVEHPSVRRISERTLLLLAALGGALGALLGMRTFHHKTRHRSFRILVPLFLLCHLLLLGWCLFRRYSL